MYVYLKSKLIADYSSYLTPWGHLLNKYVVLNPEFKVVIRGSGARMGWVGGGNSHVKMTL